MIGATAGTTKLAAPAELAELRGQFVGALNVAQTVPATVPGAIGGSEAVTPETGKLSLCLVPELSTKPSAGST